MTKVVVKQGEASLEARFVSPAFALLNPPCEGLHQHMLLHLSKYGLTLNDIRVESAVANLADMQVSYTINALVVVVRVWLDRLEIAFLDLTRVTEAQIVEISEATLQAMQQTVADIAIETYTSTLAIHGIFQQGSISQFVAPYVNQPPEGFGPVLGSGVAYYLGPDTNRRAATFVVDISTVISDAAFIRASIVLEGSIVPILHAPAVARDSVIKILKVVDLEIDGEG